MIRAVPALLILLAGCGPAPQDPGPGGVTVEEAEALDRAAEMLDSRTETATATGTGTGAGQP